ncbi:hypothetical protein [Paraburkholderia sacchari]|uniref:hypothetical protein n=1 Tax=Paraburkholderia sacchari TaxID=159450 RepID=UPI00054352C1|nr:hypothetical protein [Paraburkholderia sacchari]NLP64293.1 hypothetical protein [Paraburkholderia sacchari]
MEGPQSYLNRVLAKKVSRKAKGVVTLPTPVRAALEGARCMCREATDKGSRTLVSMPSLGHFIFEQTPDLSERIQRAWPELDAAQVARVERDIKGIALAAIARTKPPGPPRRSWAMDWDYSHSINTRDF